jgi:hypothetical protein
MSTMTVPARNGSGPSSAALPKLSSARARAMLSDLLLGFSSKSFQKKLDVLFVSPQFSQRSQDLFHVDGRKELALSVQREVLPRYGFEGNEAGVALMVKVLQPLIATDQRLAEQSEAIRQKLRLSGKTSSDSDSSDDELPNGRKRLKREKAIALQNALLAEYSLPEFQMKFRKLMRKEPDNVREERKRLIRDVHLRVLPKFGFEASDAGIDAMKEAFEEWQWDNEVRNLSKAIEEQLAVCMNDAIAERAGQGLTASQRDTQTFESHCTASSRIPSYQEHDRPLEQGTSRTAQSDERPAGISKAETLQLLQELLAGFSSPTFEWKLSLLKKARNSRDGFSLDGIEELALSVQREVLPRYGFKGTRRGVAAMISECSRYLRDQDVIDLHNAINDRLGMDAAARQRFWKHLGNSASKAH